MKLLDRRKRARMAKLGVNKHRHRWKLISAEEASWLSFKFPGPLIYSGRQKYDPVPNRIQYCTGCDSAKARFSRAVRIHDAAKKSEYYWVRFDPGSGARI